MKHTFKPYIKVRGVWVSREQWDKLQALRLKLKDVIKRPEPQLTLLNGGKK